MYWISLSFIEFHWVSLSLIESHWVSLYFIGFHWFLLNFIEIQYHWFWLNLINIRWNINVQTIMHVIKYVFIPIDLTYHIVYEYLSQLFINRYHQHVSEHIYPTVVSNLFINDKSYMCITRIHQTYLLWSTFMIFWWHTKDTRRHSE